MAKKQTPHAAAATRIRQDLKRIWPAVKFSVKSRSYTGGDSITATWTDGPTDAQVMQIMAQYEYGSFDGMIDLYTADNIREDIPQVKFVFTNREYSRERFEETVTYAANKWGVTLTPHPTENYIPSEYNNDKEVQEQTGRWPQELIHKERHHQSLICTCGTSPAIGDAYCAECGAPLQDDTRQRAENERQEAQEAGIDAFLASITR